MSDVQKLAELSLKYQNRTKKPYQLVFSDYHIGRKTRHKSIIGVRDYLLENVSPLLITDDELAVWKTMSNPEAWHTYYWLGELWEIDSDDSMTLGGWVIKFARKEDAVMFELENR